MNTFHPKLTEYGVMQVRQLSVQLELLQNDLVVVSPTRRTIETGVLLCGQQRVYISPFVGPRMFPQNSEFPILACDQIYSKDEVKNLFNITQIFDLGIAEWGEGINRIDQELFEEYAQKLIEWCRHYAKRVMIISHDGTITSYRKFLGECGLSRKDYLGECGVYKMII